MAAARLAAQDGAGRSRRTDVIDAFEPFFDNARELLFPFRMSATLHGLQGSWGGVDALDRGTQRSDTVGKQLQVIGFTEFAECSPDLRIYQDVGSRCLLGVTPRPVQQFTCAKLIWYIRSRARKLSCRPTLPKYLFRVHHFGLHPVPNAPMRGSDVRAITSVYRRKRMSASARHHSQERIHAICAAICISLLPSLSRLARLPILNLILWCSADFFSLQPLHCF